MWRRDRSEPIFGEEGATILGQALPSVRGLKRIALQHNQIADEAVNVFWEGL